MRIEKSLSKHLSKSLSKSLAGGDTPTPPTVISAIKLTFRPDLRTNVLQHLSSGAGGAGDALEKSLDGISWDSFEPGRGISGGTWTELYIRGKCGSNPIAGLCGNFVKVEGNVMTLVDWENPETAELAANQFYNTTVGRGLFQSYGESYNKQLVDASELVLPAMILTYKCYQSMFEGCTALTSAPSLPATVVGYSSYEAMFRGCTALVNVPSVLPFETAGQACCAHMFSGCESLVTAPALPATTLSEYCYGKMFYTCYALTTAPVLPATTLTTSCYMEMFAGCHSLNEIHCSATDISAYVCTSNWLQDVSATGDFYPASGTVAWGSGASGIPTNWTVHYPFTDFQEVQYLEQSGGLNCQMNTGVVGNQNTKVEIKFNGTAGAPFGSRTNPAGTDSLYVYLASNGEDIGFGPVTWCTSPLFYGNDVTLTLSKDECTAMVNGVSHAITLPASGTFTTPSNLWIWHNVTHLYTGKIYSFKIWQSDELVRNFIPCKRKSDSKVGFYDAVEHVFYTSSTAYDPTPGPEIRPFTDFQEVQYLESSGTQYIDTGVAVTDNLGVEMEYVNFTGGALFYISGSGVSDPHCGVFSDAVCWNDWQDHYDFDSTGSHKVIFALGDGYYVDGIKRLTLGAPSWSSLSWTLPMFANNRLGVHDPAQFASSGTRCYYMKISQGGTLVRNFIPCYRKSDSVAGMYDSVNHVFYTNAGTGSFIAGPEIRPFTDFQEVQYLQSDGNAYINTNYVWTTNNGRVQAKLENSFLDSIYYTYRNGGSYSSSTTTRSFILYNSTPYPRIGLGGDDVDLRDTFTIPSVGYAQELDITANEGSYSYTLNGVTKTGPYTGTIVNGLPYFIFANDENGSPGYNSAGRFYYLKMWDNGVLVRNFIPCYRKSDSVPGMYDTIGGAFYQNAGTGSFVVGPEIRPFTDFQEVQYLQSTGTQYIDTGVVVTNTLEVEMNYDAGLSANSTLFLVSGNGGSTPHAGLFMGSTPDPEVCFDIWDNHIPYDFSGSHFARFILGDGLYLDNTKVCTFGQPSWTTTNLNLFVFANNREGTPEMFANGFKVGTFKLYSASTLVRNFIPCYRKSDSVPGMYDTIGGAFYQNAGTGSFIAGPDVNA